MYEKTSLEVSDSICTVGVFRAENILWTVVNEFSGKLWVFDKLISCDEALNFIESINLVTDLIWYSFKHNAYRGSSEVAVKNIA